MSSAASHVIDLVKIQRNQRTQKKDLEGLKVFCIDLCKFLEFKTFLMNMVVLPLWAFFLN